MHRRTYLGLAAAGVAGSIAGCSSASDGSDYPPYPDSETIELSGEGVEVSDEFELTLDGPTLVDIEHEGEDNFTVILEDADEADREISDETNETNETDGSDETNETNETDESTDNETENTTADDGENGEESVREPVANVASAVGPYDGRSLLPIDTGSYVMTVLEADAEWTATIYDLPAYEDGTGVSLPIERESQQYDVIGPIDFGEQSDTEFSFSATGEGLHRVFLTDREGNESLTVMNFEGENEDAVSQEVGGVGYLEILSYGSWTVKLS